MKLPVALLVPALVCACAHVEELPDGARRVTGLVSMTIPASIPQEKRGADSLQVTTLGLMILSSPAAASIQLGYASDRITAVRNNALVEISEWEERP
jgi:hypothetical protein